MTSNAIDFEGINAAAQCAYRILLPDLIPGGKFIGDEYVVKNPCRNDQHPGSFKINFAKGGVWADFATNESGSDFISLVAHLRSVDQGEAARELAAKLKVALHKVNRNSGGDRPAAASSKTSTTQQATKLYKWGPEGPPRWPNEIRRHFYPSSGVPVKVKIKRKDTAPAWSNCYRIFVDGLPTGWEWKKPNDYHAIPYVSRAIDPFDPELIADEIFWPEGEKDVDTLGKINLPAFTFGGTGDGLPDEIASYLRGRRLVILSDNDSGGRHHAQQKARGRIRGRSLLH
jgi:putative DNA primase/helicase